MNTVGWVFILVGILLVRQVFKGRVMNLGEDLTDAFIALVSGNTNELTAVLARSGEAAHGTVVTGTSLGEGEFAPHIAGASGTNATILQSAMALGKAAKGYRFTATGPDYYDCSGLVWRAVQKAGFKGGRFTTFNIGSLKSFRRVSNTGDSAANDHASGVMPGDIVVWPTHHMGVVTSPGRFYSARSVRSGISEANIAGFRKEAPIYYRYVG